jgi:hypothetical protein
MSLFSHVLDDRCIARELWAMVEKFAAWLDDSGYASYHPDDIWATRYGLWARRLYDDYHPPGIANSYL